jgi:oligoribonuclease NrnB/cAMP/cGMP phosphodiesterase (DHH superfamily)
MGEYKGMNNRRRVLLTHYDLDGVGCDILLSKIWEFTKKHFCGYGKVKSKIDTGELAWFDSCVVSDISLTENQFNTLEKEYGKSFLYIDHHRPSVHMIENVSPTDVTCIVNSKFSATALILQTFHKKLLDTSPTTIKFISAIDGYDMWRYKTHPEIFARGYDLNILFWKYGYFDFYSRFSYNMSLDFLDKELYWIQKHKKERDRVLDESLKTDFGNNSLLIINAPTNYINDYALQYPEYDFYYMVCADNNGNLKLSIRTDVDNKDLSVGQVLRDIKKGHFDIVSAGGHTQSGGVNFDKDVSLDHILDVVEEINNTFEGIMDLPF